MTYRKWPNPRRWLTEIGQIPAYDKLDLARSRNINYLLVSPTSQFAKSQKRIWWIEQPKAIFREQELTGIFKLETDFPGTEKHRYTNHCGWAKPPPPGHPPYPPPPPSCHSVINAINYLCYVNYESVSSVAGVICKAIASVAVLISRVPNGILLQLVSRNRDKTNFIIT